MSLTAAGRRQRPPRALLASLGLSLALHLALIAYGAHQDRTSSLKYTDVDYVVLSDAARLTWPPSTEAEAEAAGPLGGAWIGRWVSGIDLESLC